MTKLDRAIIKEYNKYKKSSQRKIIERIDEIVNFIAKLYNKKLSDWHFIDYDEDHLIELLSGGFERTHIIYAKNGNQLYYIDDNKEIMDWFSRGIPIRWLFEDYSEELVDRKVRYDIWIENQRQHDRTIAEEKAKRKNEIISSIKNKLTQEELEFVGLTDKNKGTKVRRR